MGRDHWDSHRMQVALSSPRGFDSTLNSDWSIKFFDLYLIHSILICFSTTLVYLAGDKASPAGHFAESDSSVKGIARSDAAIIM